MNKKFLAVLIAAFATSPVIAGSLDVHGDIKVNGKTVIDAQGNYVGSLPSQVDIVDISSYLNPALGIKKTYSQTQGLNNESYSGTRIEDYTTENVVRYTYKWPTQGSVYTNTETYYSADQWISSGTNCTYDPDSSDESSCVVNWYGYQSYKKDTVYWQDEIQTGGSFLESFRQTSTTFFCNSDDENYGNGPCEVTGADYLGDSHYDPVVTNYNQVVMVLNRLAFKNETLSYDDCIALQFNGNNESPWTGIYCKDVGMVKGWSNGYLAELTSVDGTAIKSMPKAPMVSLRAMAPVVKK